MKPLVAGTASQHSAFCVLETGVQSTTSKERAGLSIHGPPATVVTILQKEPVMNSLTAKDVMNPKVLSVRDEHDPPRAGNFPHRKRNLWGSSPGRLRETRRRRLTDRHCTQ